MTVQIDPEFTAQLYDQVQVLTDRAGIGQSRDFFAATGRNRDSDGRLGPVFADGVAPMRVRR